MSHQSVRRPRRSIAAIAAAALVMTLMGAAPAAAAADGTTVPAATSSISGSVSDAATGAPIGNVSVTAIDHDGAQRGAAITDGQGVYSVEDLPAGDYRLSFSNDPGYDPTFFPTGSGLAEAQAVTLGEAEARTGVDVTLFARTVASADPESAAELPTDPEQAEVEVDAPGANEPEQDEPTEGSSAVEGSDEVAARVVAETEPMTTAATAGEWTVSGAVRDASGSPIEGVRVQVSGPDFTSVTTAPDGTYAAVVSYAGEYVVSFWMEGYVPQYYDRADFSQDSMAVMVSEADVSGIDAALSRGGTISGQIRDADGVPIVGASVSASTPDGRSSGYAQSDDQGRYVIDVLRNGSYIVSASASGSGFYTKYFPDADSRDGATPVDIVAEKIVEGVDVTLEQGSRASGSVTDSRGVPVSGGWVTARSSAASATTQVDSSGNFELSGLAPGVWTVSATGNSGAYLPGTATFSVPGDVTDLRIVLEDAAQLSGTVAWPSGTQASGAVVVARVLDDGSLEEVRSTYVYSPGSYSIGIIPEGSYVVFVNVGQFGLQFYDGATSVASATRVDLVAGETRTGVNFSVDREVNIRGTVGGDGPTPQGGALITAYLWDAGGWQPTATVTGWGAYSFEGWQMSSWGSVSGWGLPAGTYTVGFEAPGYCPQYYDGKRDLGSATQFALAPGESADQIDGSLSAACEQPAVVPGSPIIEGELRPGQTLRADAGDWSPQPVALAYQWFADGQPLAGETADTLVVTGEMVGAEVTVQVTGSRPGYTSATADSPGVVIVSNALSVGVPTIAGEPEAGETLTADPGEWGPAPVELAYQWFADDDAILGATSTELVLSQAEVGRMISVVVTGSKPGYTTESARSAPVGPVTGAPLLELVPGVVTVSGEARVGESLTADPGEWGPAPVALAYQWYVDGVAVAGATETVFAPRPGDVGAEVVVAVTGTKPGYNPAVRQASGGVVEPGVLDSSTPVISGEVEVGAVLTASAGEWGPSPVDLAYQWYADGALIDGATAETWEVAPATVGAMISVVVTGSKPGYTSGSRESDAVGPVALGSIVAAEVTVSGVPRVGEPLVASTDPWGPAPVELTYQWMRDDVPIEGATDSTFTPESEDVGSLISVVVTGTKPGYESATRAASAAGPVGVVVRLSTDTVVVGGEVTVFGYGFAPNEPVTVTLHSTPTTIGGGEADGDGNVEIVVTIPVGTTIGAHEIELAGDESERSGRAPLSVTAAGAGGGDHGGGTTGQPGVTKPGAGSSPLPATGGEIPTGVILFGVLLLLGGAAVIGRRRQREGA